MLVVVVVVDVVVVVVAVVAVVGVLAFFFLEDNHREYRSLPLQAQFDICSFYYVSSLDFFYRLAFLIVSLIHE